jgi:hypothetical protein
MLELAEDCSRLSINIKDYVTNPGDVMSCARASFRGESVDADVDIAASSVPGAKQVQHAVSAGPCERASSLHRPAGVDVLHEQRGPVAISEARSKKVRGFVADFRHGSGFLACKSARFDGKLAEGRDLPLLRPNSTVRQLVSSPLRRHTCFWNATRFAERLEESNGTGW